MWDFLSYSADWFCRMQIQTHSTKSSMTVRLWMHSYCFVLVNENMRGQRLGDRDREEGRDRVGRIVTQIWNLKVMFELIDLFDFASLKHEGWDHLMNWWTTVGKKRQHTGSIWWNQKWLVIHNNTYRWSDGVHLLYYILCRRRHTSISSTYTVGLEMQHFVRIVNSI